MEGHGVYTWADGRMYIGEYLKSERSGKGRCVFEKWDYEGMWKNDQFHGVGKKTLNIDLDIFELNITFLSVYNSPKFLKFSN